MNETPSRPGKGGWVAATLTLALFLGVLEIVLRLWVITPTRPQEYTPDGWVEAPGARIVHSQEGYSVSRLNSYGFHDDEPQAGRPGPPRQWKARRLSETLSAPSTRR